MDIDLIFKIAAVGILVAVLKILLQRSGPPGQLRFRAAVLAGELQLLRPQGHAVQVAVGVEDQPPLKGHQPLGGVAALKIAVARHRIKPQAGKLFPNLQQVADAVAQKKHGIGIRHRGDGPAQGGGISVTVGHNHKTGHSSPSSSRHSRR